MKPKYIIGLLVILVFVVFAAINLSKSLTPYVSVQEARESQKVVQVKGQRVVGSENFDIENKIFKFKMADEKGEEFEVIYHGVKPANLELLEEILIRLSQLVTDFAEIQEIDINPLTVTANGFCAIDARVFLCASETPAPLHLVISPYPDQYEEHITTDTGINIFLRPIRPEDAPLLVELFESLSPRSVYLRFFTPLKRLPHSMLALFTQIDYDRHIALVAMSETQTDEKMLGVARVIIGRNPKEAEFAVAVGDPWQGKGIGAALLKRCLEIARERGIENVHGTVLSENTQMLTLGRRLGFKIKRVEDAPEYELTIDFSKQRRQE